MEKGVNIMKPLPERVRKNGFTYFLLQRTPKKAIYIQTYDNVQVGFEVFLIKVRGTQYSHILCRNLQPCERFPCNEDFGKSAWSFRGLDDAIKKYDAL